MTPNQMKLRRRAVLRNWGVKRSPICLGTLAATKPRGRPAAQPFKGSNRGFRHGPPVLFGDVSESFHSFGGASRQYVKAKTLGKLLRNTERLGSPPLFTVGTSINRQCTYVDENKKNPYWDHGQPQQPPPAQSGHNQQRQQDLYYGAKSPGQLKHTNTSCRRLSMGSVSKARSLRATGLLRFLWVIERALVHHLCLRLVFPT